MEESNVTDDLFVLDDVDDVDVAIFVGDDFSDLPLKVLRLGTEYFALVLLAIDVIALF